MLPIPDDFDLQPVDTIPIKSEEAREQARLVAALRRQWNLMPDEIRPIVFAIPNGGQRDAREGANLKAQGVLAGVPDLCIALAAGRTLWIEMKATKGKLSTVQVDIHSEMKAKRHEVITAYSAEDALAQLRVIL